MAGKVELDTIDDRGDDVLGNLVAKSVLTVFRERCSTERLTDVVSAFDGGKVVHAGDDLPAVEYLSLLDSSPALRDAVTELVGGDERPGTMASAVEFVLEGLHLSKRLNKDAVGARATYRSRR
jgi:magnesium chelatase subunit I